MGNPEVSQFLTHLAVNRKVAASTQNQAFSALLFLYSQVPAALRWVGGCPTGQEALQIASGLYQGGSPRRLAPSKWVEMVDG
jgi:hypothetical protein